MTTRLPLAALLSLLLSAPAARACGGFFCTTFPMNQAAENILFVQGEGTVTTHVQLLYSGAASDFAWILPVPAVPELAVSHNQIFTQLQWTTRPGFRLNFQEDDCGFPMVFRDGGLESIPTSAEGEVEVVLQEQVGPYDTAVITSEDPQAIVDWLVDNGYQLGDLGVPLLSPYVEEDFYFLALKLAAESEVGDLQPIAMTYAAERPGIPIRLTAVATEPDLGILAWVLADQRAIPENYLHVRINEALIDWWSGGFNYPAVVTQAANEAGGQAFVTDYAGPSSIVGEFFFGELDVEELRGKTHPADFLDAALGQGFPRDTQMQTLIRRHIPMSDAVLDEGVLEVVFDGDRAAYDRAREEGWLLDAAERSFYNNMRAYDPWTADLDFDPSAFADDLQRIVVEPLGEVGQLFDEKPYLTRLYTTLSADEMTVDPMFDYNPDLPAVDNVRSADARWDCGGDPETPLEKWELVVTLSDGREVRSTPFVDGGPMPFAEPAAFAVEQLRSSGPPEIITAVATVNAPASTPSDWTLLQNYPNPFNGSTVLPFVVPRDARVTLHVYNLQGQRVRTLIEGEVAPGYGEVSWDGRDQHGRPVAGGVYLYRLESGVIRETRKLLFLR